jgi:membrane fusion protein (multidrug efflux system)
VILAVLLIGAYVAIDWDSLAGPFNRQPSTDDAYLRADVTPLSAHISGYVKALHFDDNQRVKAGQVLVEIDDRDFQAQVAAALANRDAASASLAATRVQMQAQNSVVDQAKADLRKAQAVYDVDERERKRVQGLFTTGAASQQRQETTSSKTIEDQATVAGARAKVQLEQTKLVGFDATLKEQNAELASKQAAFDLAKVTLGYTKITAPADGTVGQRGIQLGQLAHDGTFIATLIPSARIWVVAYFREAQTVHIRPGQPAHIRVDAWGGAELDGHVESIGPGTQSTFAVLPSENATGNFTKIAQRVPVRILIDTKDASGHLPLRPGLSVEARVDTRGTND